VHPYTEEKLPELHPAGVHLDVSGVLFNAVEAGKAVDIVMKLLDNARSPVSPYGRWIERWVESTVNYYTSVLDPLRERRAQAPEVP
jgi:hypothetical protein